MIEDLYDEHGNIVYVKCPSKHKNMRLELFSVSDLEDNLDNLNSATYNKIAHIFDLWDYDIYQVLLDDEIEYYSNLIFNRDINDSLIKEIIERFDFSNDSYLTFANPVEQALKEFGIKKFFESIITSDILDYYDSLEIWEELYHKTEDIYVGDLIDYYPNYMYMVAKLREDSKVNDLKNLLTKLEYNSIFNELNSFGVTKEDIDIIYDMHLYDLNFLGEHNIDMKIMELELKNENPDYYKAIKYLITYEDQNVKDKKLKEMMYDKKYIELYLHLSN